MALDVYVKEDILNVLRALHVSSEVPAALAIDLLQDCDLPVKARGSALLRSDGTSDDGTSDGGSSGAEALAQDQVLAYQKGFRTALASVALAFGLVPVASAMSSSSSRSVSSRSRDRQEVDLRSFVESMVRSEA
jgi:hypothetical protein